MNRTYIKIIFFWDNFVPTLHKIHREKRRIYLPFCSFYLSSSVYFNYFWGKAKDHYGQIRTEINRLRRCIVIINIIIAKVLVFHRFKIQNDQLSE